MKKHLIQLVGNDAVTSAARLTKGFSFAQLNEFYVSAALQHHYDNRVNCEGLIQEMNQAQNKSRMHVWYDEQMEQRIGFN
ncbi:hypothetical protein EHS13_04765 [Paenibacillus psychroresistens]|uniref:Uncharacterized protein n=1 Tax=Paenibacillus psychroresistens TaxID=1778678 RepID=A0A6B8RFF7_9BACL|nr:hypothetical protein [Paenibacillus psychroresistens]QGQ94263.1 hypothetical protein EHS13_04765 [Paenibacillus psychroresistens]